MRSRRAVSVLVVVAAACVAMACGDDGSTGADGSAATGGSGGAGGGQPSGGSAGEQTGGTGGAAGAGGSDVGVGADGCPCVSVAYSAWTELSCHCDNMPHLCPGLCFANHPGDTFTDYPACGVVSVHVRDINREMATWWYYDRTTGELIAKTASDQYFMQYRCSAVPGGIIRLFHYGDRPDLSACGEGVAVEQWEVCGGAAGASGAGGNAGAAGTAGTAGAGGAAGGGGAVAGMAGVAGVAGAAGAAGSAGATGTGGLGEGIRLAGGTTAADGILEVQYAGEWRGVCDDSWSTTETNVVCRELFGLSYTGTYSSTTGTSSEFWLDEVNCTGTETSLFDCTHDPWGTHNCGTSEHLRITCVP